MTQQKAAEEAKLAKGKSPTAAEPKADETPTSLPVPGGPQDHVEDDERGGMDNMLAALRSGSAFHRRGPAAQATSV